MSIAPAWRQASPQGRAGGAPPLEGQVRVLLVADASAADAAAHDAADDAGAGVCVRHAQVASERPAQTARLLLGRTVEQAQALLPMLHSLCGRAHVAAFLLAVRATRGEPQAWRAMNRREDAPLLLEMLREHLVQALLGWPALLRQGKESGATAVLQGKVDEAMPLLRTLSAAPAQPAREQQQVARGMPRRLALLLGEDAHAFLRRDATALLRWMQASDSIAACLLRQLQGLRMPMMPRLPALTADDLPHIAERLAQDVASAARFAARPALPEGAAADDQSDVDIGAGGDSAAGMDADDGCRISGAWARWRDHAVMAELPPLAAMFMARLLDAAMLACLAGEDDMPMPFASGQAALPGTSSLRIDGMGVAAVDTARGLLVHAVALDEQQCVAQWRMVAPTEWHCHPRGLAARWLQRLRAEDTAMLEQAARLLMQAVDPCVGCAIEVRTWQEAERANA